MDEDKLLENVIVDDFTPLTHALEKIKEQENGNNKKGVTTWNATTEESKA